MGYGNVKRFPATAVPSVSGSDHGGKDLTFHAAAPRCAVVSQAL
jgi:hypothetical protein